MSECKCPECGDEYDYIELRKPLDMGLDVCPNCGVEVCEIEYKNFCADIEQGYGFMMHISGDKK